MTATTITAPAAVTAALDSTTERRRITGMLVPYGPTGHTNVGPLTVTAGAIRLPHDLSRVKLLREERGHDRVVPVGHLIAAESRPDGLFGTFLLGTTPDAQAAYTEAAEGLRDGLSVELHNVTSGRPGEVVAADLTAALLVATPAFADARAVAASHTTSPATGEPADDDQENTDDPDTESTDDQDGQQADDQEETDMTTSTDQAPAPVTAAAPAGLPTDQRVSGVQSMADVYAALAAVHTGRATPEVVAVLSDITNTANQSVAPQQYAGELWSGVGYQRQIVPLVTNRDLTSYKVQGWRWVTKPAVALWTGDKADVPSNQPTTEPVDTEAQRLAGAHDLDRKFRDFNDTEFFASYYQAMTESYAVQSDAAAAAALSAGATAVPDPAADLLAAIVAGALALPDGIVPTFVLFSKDLLPAAFSLTRDTVPALLSVSLGLDGTGAVDGVRLRSHSAVPAGTVIVGARPAATFYELPGVPIRVEAVDLVRGGVDAGVFGYFANIINHAAALQRVTVGAGGAALADLGVTLTNARKAQAADQAKRHNAALKAAKQAVKGRRSAPAADDADTAGTGDTSGQDA